MERLYEFPFEVCCTCTLDLGSNVHCLKVCSGLTSLVSL
jgi:hypothetical protein